MLGSVADAEDVVQDAFLRWLDVDRVRCASRQHFCAESSRAWAWTASRRSGAVARPMSVSGFRSRLLNRRRKKSTISHAKSDEASAFEGENHLVDRRREQRSEKMRNDHLGLRLVEGVALAERGSQHLLLCGGAPHERGDNPGKQN